MDQQLPVNCCQWRLDAGTVTTNRATETIPDSSQCLRGDRAQICRALSLTNAGSNGRGLWGA